MIEFIIGLFLLTPIILIVSFGIGAIIGGVMGLTRK